MDEKLNFSWAKLNRSNHLFPSQKVIFYKRIFFFFCYVTAFPTQTRLLFSNFIVVLLHININLYFFAIVIIITVVVIVEVVVVVVLLLLLLLFLLIHVLLLL